MKIDLNKLSALIAGGTKFAESVLGPGEGAKKLTLVTTIAQMAILAAAMTGVVEPHEANNVIHIQDHIESVLEEQKAKGEIK